MSRLERLVNLTAALLSAERPLTSDDLRDRISGYPTDKLSFRRQFERDKEALRELGFPLVSTELISGVTTYAVDRESYYLRDPGLSPDELSALTMASEVIKLNGLGDKRLYDAMWKLDAAPNRNADASVVVTPPLPFEADLPADASLATIFEAIAGGRIITFSYKDAPRNVVPRSLSFEKGRWYVAAYDLGRSDERSFRVDRIDGEVTLGSEPSDKVVIPQAPPRTSASKSPWELGDGTAIPACVLIDAPHAVWAERHVGTQAVATRHADGSLELALNVRNRDAFRSFVLGFLDGAEVLAPPELRADFVAWLHAKISAQEVSVG
jgi:proteasome accessory factor B